MKFLNPCLSEQRQIDSSFLWFHNRALDGEAVSVRGWKAVTASLQWLKSNCLLSYKYVKAASQQYNDSELVFHPSANLGCSVYSPCDQQHTFVRLLAETIVQGALQHLSTKHCVNNDNKTKSLESDPYHLKPGLLPQGRDLDSLSPGFTFHDPSFRSEWTSPWALQKAGICDSWQCFISNTQSLLGKQQQRSL